MASSANHGFTFRSITGLRGCRQGQRRRDGREKKTNKLKKTHTKHFLAQSCGKMVLSRVTTAIRTDFFHSPASPRVERAAASVATSGSSRCEKLLRRQIESRLVFFLPRPSCQSSTPSTKQPHRQVKEKCSHTDTRSRRPTRKSLILFHLQSRNKSELIKENE